MKKLLVMMGVMIAAVSFAIFAKKYPGYMLIDIEGYTIEVTLVFAGMVIVGSFALLYICIRILANLSKVRSGIRYWHDSRSKNKADESLISGLVKLAECKWSDSEQQVLRYVSKAKSPLLNYLAAARAAQEQGAFERRDSYLSLAQHSMPEANIAVGITQAELQLSQNQNEPALATLRHLQQLAPKHPKVLKTLAKLYADLADWGNVIQILPALRKNKVMPHDMIHLLEKTAFLNLLHAAENTTENTTENKVENNTEKNIQDLWYRVPSALQTDEDILVAYVEQLLLRKNSDIAEPLIRNALKKKWSEKLIQLYGVIEAVDPQSQMSFVENLLIRHQSDAMLLLTLGRLSLRNRLWGKARTYLEASIGASPNAQAYAELGHLLESLGKKEEAMACYSNGLALVPGCGENRSKMHAKAIGHPAELDIQPPVTKLLANNP